MTVQASQASLCILTLCTVNLVYAYNVMYYVESTVNVVYVFYGIVQSCTGFFSSVFATFHR